MDRLYSCIHWILYISWNYPPLKMMKTRRHSVQIPLDALGHFKSLPLFRYKVVLVVQRIASPPACRTCRTLMMRMVVVIHWLFLCLTGLVLQVNGFDKCSRSERERVNLILYCYSKSIALTYFFSKYGSNGKNVSKHSSGVCTSVE